MSGRTRRTIKDSLQTFVVACWFFAIAILLTYVKDLALYLHRPAWLVHGIEGLSAVFFLGDALVAVGLVGRVVARGLRGLMEELKED